MSGCMHGSGFTLVEAMIGIGLLAIFVALSVRFYGKQKVSLERNQARVSMYNDVKFFENLLSSPGILAISAFQAGNNALLRCLQVAGGNCLELPANTWEPFELFEPETARRISGRPNAPIAYDKFGRECDANTLRCAYSISTEFRPRCFPGQPMCESAQMILVRYTVQPLIARTPPLQIIREIDVGFSNIWTRLNQQCPADYAVSGITYAYELHCINLQGDQGLPQVILP